MTDPFSPEARAHIAAHPEIYNRPPKPEPEPITEAMRNGWIYLGTSVYAFGTGLSVELMPGSPLWQQLLAMPAIFALAAVVVCMLAVLG